MNYFLGSDTIGVAPSSVRNNHRRLEGKARRFSERSFPGERDGNGYVFLRKYLWVECVKWRHSRRNRSSLTTWRIYPTVLMYWNTNSHGTICH